MDEPALPAPGRSLPGASDEPFGLVRPAYALSSPGQIGLAAFLGGPLAGFLLIARNYARLHRRGAAWLTVLVGILVTAAVVAGSGFLLPDLSACAGLLIAVPVWLGVYLAGRWLQGPALQKHREQGGAEASGWGVVGYSLLGAALTFVPITIGVILYEVGFGDQHLTVSAKEEIYYSQNVTEAEARQVARVLQDIGIFNGTGGKTVRLSKDGGEYVLSFVLLVGHDDARTQTQFQSHARRVSAALGGKPVRVELCDMLMTPRKKLPAVRAGDGKDMRS